MNINRKVAVILALSSSLAFSSQAVELKAADNSTYTQLCMTAASGNRAALYNAIKNTGHSKKFITKSVQCNSADMVAFVQQYGRNVDKIVDALQRSGTSVTIQDLAMLSRKYR
ncbi:MAG: DUF3718 domain-containing protein [Thalassotalea sp.]